MTAEHVDPRTNIYSWPLRPNEHVSPRMIQLDFYLDSSWKSSGLNHDGCELGDPFVRDQYSPGSTLPKFGWGGEVTAAVYRGLRAQMA